MQPQTKHDVEQLNSLIEATIDSADGYQAASEADASSRFTTLFRARTTERREIVRGLQGEVRRLGGEAEETGATLAKTKRWFANLGNSIIGDDASMIAEVEAGEDNVKAVYETVLKDQAISINIRTMVGSAYGKIKADHDQMRDLKLQQQARRAG